MKHLIPFLKTPPRVAVIRLAGTIGAAGRFSSGLNDETLAPMIDRAFRAGKPAAIALVINSPGGSPVQSALIGARIRRLADEKKLPVHAFVEDVAASGGYWLACAADDIWADENSVLGSIGVISASFGAHEWMARQGLERRVQTAGNSKSLGDPFRPQTEDDIARLRVILEQIHANFIAHVTARRGTRLDAQTDLFQGDIWVGAEAVRLGLADGIGHLVPKLKDLYGNKVRLVPMTTRRGLLQRFGFGAGLGTIAGAAAHGLADAAEERALWARYGL